MGHGWTETGRTRFISEEKCSYGNGKIKTYAEIEESDYPPFERDSDRWEECVCSVQNCPHRKSGR